MLLIGNVNVLKPLAKSVLILLRLTEGKSTTYAAIYKKMFGSDARPSDLAKQTNLIIGISQTIKNKGKEQKRGFLELFFGT